MDNKTNSAEIEPTLNLAGALGFDLDIAAQLGAKANGAKIEVLVKPGGMLGVPDAIPVALLRGVNPEFKSVANLFEAYRTHPALKQGTAAALTFESFCELVNRHSTADSAVFADTDWTKPSLTAVIDYHEAKSAGLAAFGRHRVHYPFPLSEEWKVWIKGNNQPMDQLDFAQFLEDRVPELSSPTEEERIRFERDFNTTLALPNQLIELSRGLQVNVDSKVKAQNVLQTGESQIVFEETHNDASGKPIKVPGLFIIHIAPFFMGDKIRIPARLRYRVKGGAVVWFYQLYRPDLAITEHVRETLFRTRENTGLPVYEGKPEVTA